jgi:hypothetical protein
VIEDGVEGVCDTHVRERIVGLLEDNFINHEGCSKIPSRLGSDDSNAEMRLNRALTTFLAGACAQEARFKLTFKQRAELLANGGGFLEGIL